jgi:hypothetical protein
MTKEMELWFSTWESSEHQLETLRDSLRRLGEENRSLIRINRDLCKAPEEEATENIVTFGRHIVDTKDRPIITDRNQFDPAQPLRHEVENRGTEKALYIIQQEEQVSHHMIGDNRGRDEMSNSNRVKGFSGTWEILFGQSKSPNFMVDCVADC